MVCDRPPFLIDALSSLWRPRRPVPPVHHDLVMELQALRREVQELRRIVAAAHGAQTPTEATHAPQKPLVRVSPTAPVDTRAEAASKIVHTLAANGGRARASVRALGRMVGAKRSTAHAALLMLIASGAVVRTGEELVLRA